MKIRNENFETSKILNKYTIEVVNRSGRPKIAIEVDGKPYRNFLEFNRTVKSWGMSEVFSRVKLKN